MVRGEIDQPGQVGSSGVSLACCATATSRSKRGRAADWNWPNGLAATDNPLTARVMVNRIWQNMIGQGIVDIDRKFWRDRSGPQPSGAAGLLGRAICPVGLVGQDDHPRDRFVARLSNQFGLRRERAHQYDPDNALLWRANPRRLDAEAIRDAMLMVSGEIDLQRPRGSEVAKQDMCAFATACWEIPVNEFASR